MELNPNNTTEITQMLFYFKKFATKISDILDCKVMVNVVLLRNRPTEGSLIYRREAKHTLVLVVLTKSSSVNII